MDSKLEKAVIKGKNGDKQSLTEIYNETKNMVYFTVLKLTKNESDAQDLVQDTYIKAFENLEKLNDEKSFIKWLKTIAVNLSKNYLKKCKPQLFKTDEKEEQELANIPEISEDFLPAEYAEQKEKRRLIMEIVDNLSDLQRTAVLLYYFDELPIGEVARIMETSEGTTKSRLNYARKQIKEEVEAQEKKGTKLYGGVPILTIILQNASKDYQIPADVSVNIFRASLEATSQEVTSPEVTSLKASGSKTSAAADGAKIAGTGTAGLVAKFTAASLATKLIAGIVAVGIIVGGGMGISKIVKNTSQPAQKGQSSALKTGSSSQLENIQWEQLLGKTKEEIIGLLGQPVKEDGEKLYYNAVPAAIEIQLYDGNTADMISCQADNYSVQGLKKGDTLENVKSTFAGITGATLDQENVDCGSLSAIFYTIGDYSYQFLYDKNNVVKMFSISLIHNETVVEESGAEETNVRQPSQGSEPQPEQSEGDKGTLPAEQAPSAGDSAQTGAQAPPVTNTGTKIAVEDLIFADEASIIKRLGKPIYDTYDENNGTMLYDGINFNRDIENKEINSTTHQQNFMMTIDDGKYSAYGFYPGMTKQEFLRNAQNYGIGKEEDGTYAFYFPGGGTTVELYVEFSGDDVFDIILQAFVAW